jgi:hypothetical protein
MLDEKRLLELIAASPLIRTMELVDKLDCEFCELEPLLQQEVAAGNLVAQPVTGPNGRRATGYSVSDGVRGILSNAGVSGKAARPLSAIDKAIAFVTERGTATSAELHSLLNLPANELVSRALGGALSDGRLVKSGKFWSLAGGNDDREQDTGRQDPVAGAPVANAAFPSTSAPVPAPPAPQVAEPDEHETKGDRVVDFIKRQPNRRATNNQLREVLGLGAGQFPAAHLNECIKTGRLARHGDNWILGPGASLDEDRSGLPPVPDGQDKGIEIPVFTAKKANVDDIVTVQIVAAPQSGAQFRIGDWSDGTIELQRNGVRVASLTKEEFDQVGRFWNLRVA